MQRVMASMHRHMPAHKAHATHVLFAACGGRQQLYSVFQLQIRNRQRPNTLVSFNCIRSSIKARLCKCLSVYRP